MLICIVLILGISVARPKTVMTSKRIVPTEVGVPSARLQSYVAEVNDHKMRIDLDFSKKRLELSAIHTTEYKSALAQCYNSRVREIQFNVGDLVLGKNSISRVQSQGKLDPKWKGPYQVVKAGNARHYKLAYQGSTILS